METLTGILDVYIEKKNNGFIHVVKDGQVNTYFLHNSNILSGVPRAGATVKFRSARTRRGLIAIEAEIVDTPIAVAQKGGEGVGQ